MGQPVFHFYVRHSAHDELDFLEVEHEHQGFGDDFVESDEELWGGGGRLVRYGVMEYYGIMDPLSLSLSLTSLS